MVTIPFNPGGTDPGQIKQLIYQAASKAPSVHYSLAAASGPFDFNTDQISLTHDRKIVAGSGPFDFNTDQINLARGRKIVAGSGPFDFNTDQISLTHDWNIVAASGPFDFNTDQVSIEKTPNISGLGILQGRVWRLVYQSSSALEFVPKDIVPDSGSYPLVGSTAALQKNKPVAAGSGSYLLAGGDAGFISGTAPAETLYWTWTLSGQIRRLIYRIEERPVFFASKSLIAGVGAYELSGAIASLVHGAGFFLFGSSLIPGRIRGLTYAETSEPPYVPPTPLDDEPLPPLRTRNLIVKARFAPPNLFKAVTAASGSYVLAGTQAATNLGRSTIADASGVFYSLAGTAILLPRTRRIAAGPATYDMAGTIAIPRLPHQLIGDVGNYPLVGQAAQTLWGRRPTAGVAAYLLTGTAAFATKLRTVLASSGSYQLAGTAAALMQRRKIAATGADYEYLGQDTSGLITRSVHVTAGNYSLNGTAAASSHGFRLTAGSGAIPLVGANAATFGTPAHSIGALPGAYVLTGSPVTLGHSWYLTEPDSGTYALSGTSLDRLFQSKRLQAFEIDEDDNQVVPFYEWAGLPIFSPHARVLDAVRGAPVLGGSSVVIRQPARISAGAGAYALEGFDAIPRTGIAALASGGTYTLAGSDADLTYRRTVVARTAYLPLVGNGVRVRKAGPAASLLFNERTVNVPAILRETSVRRDQNRTVRVPDERVR